MTTIDSYVHTIFGPTTPAVRVRPSTAVEVEQAVEGRLEQPGQHGHLGRLLSVCCLGRRDTRLFFPFQGCQIRQVRGFRRELPWGRDRASAGSYAALQRSAGCSRIAVSTTGDAFYGVAYVRALLNLGWARPARFSAVLCARHDSGRCCLANWSGFRPRSTGAGSRGAQRQPVQVQRIRAADRRVGRDRGCCG